MASKQQDGNQKQGGSGNFANDPQRASEAGKKGGQQSHQGSTGSGKGPPTDTAKARQGGSGNFADDPERASEAGRKGGQKSSKS